MTFDPLGPFRFEMTKPLRADVVSAAKDLIGKLPATRPGDRDDGFDPGISRIYDHWTVEAQGCVDSAYNLVVTKQNGAFAICFATDIRKNERTYDAHGNVNDPLPPGYAEHTYRRNTGAIGIALDGMDGTGVGPYNFGNDPITTMGLLYLCAANAAAAHKYEIDLMGLSLDSNPFYGEPTLFTHSEAAHTSGTPPAYQPYFLTDHPDDGDTRFDLSTFVPLPAGVEPSYEHAVICGDAIRIMSHRIKLALS